MIEIVGNCAAITGGRWGVGEGPRASGDRRSVMQFMRARKPRPVPVVLQSGPPGPPQTQLLPPAHILIGLIAWSTCIEVADLVAAGPRGYCLSREASLPCSNNSSELESGGSLIINYNVVTACLHRQVWSVHIESISHYNRRSVSSGLAVLPQRDNLKEDEVSHTDNTCGLIRGSCRTESAKSDYAIAYRSRSEAGALSTQSDRLSSARLRYLSYRGK
ncbi:hypothetical protein J6590_023421 [Homalodisca vitripennis]|nr:hypothetical protein J6590_023421 [Homalodisca vitripennis]